MFNLIIKNIWARRRRNGWLFIELVAVAIVSWVIFDPVVVGLYVRNLPTGYDTDRLCRISLGRYYEGASEFSADADSTCGKLHTIVRLCLPWIVWQFQLNVL